MMKNFVLALAVLLFVVSVCAENTTVTVDYTHDGNFAESFGYSATGNFFVIGNGFNPDYSLAKVYLNGTVESYLQDSRLQHADLLSLGIKIDDETDTIYFVVANTSVAFGGPYTGGLSSAFVTADVLTGEVSRFVDLSIVGGNTAANDLVTDGNGTWYITDTASARVIKVNSDDDVTVFAQSPLFKPTPETPFGSDGIVWFSDDLLIVGNFATGVLSSVTNAGSTVNEIVLNGCTLERPDGIITDENDYLYIANNIQPNPPSRVYVLTSTDNWFSAECFEQGTSDWSGGSALTWANGNLFMSHSPYPAHNSSAIDLIYLEDIGTTTTGSSGSGLAY